MNDKFLSLLFFLTLCCFGFSQSSVANIDIISFNSSATYGPGSGVSVHLNAEGIFQMDDPEGLGTNDPLNNKFTLELINETSGANTTLSTIYDFYVPLMNGVIPTDTPPGTYRLRVVASLGFISQGNYGEISELSSPFTISADLFDNYTNIVSGIVDNTISNNYFHCHDNGYNSEINSPTPYAGSLNRGLGATTPTTSSSVPNFTFVANQGSSYNASLFDITNGGVYSQSLDLDDIGFGIYSVTIMDEDNDSGLPIGTYNLEIQEINSNGISSIYSAIFLWHSNNTNLGNTTSETICLNEEVIFSIDNTMEGIARNYQSSYYSFDFGDGSDIEYFTHAELMAIGEVKHIYDQVSCANNPGTSSQSNYVIEKELYNKFRTNISGSCDDFSINGLGAIKEVNVSVGPEASFTTQAEQCETSPITATNTSTLGQWGLNGTCLDDATFEWYVKPPTNNNFINVNSIPQLSGWLVDDNLVIPEESVTPGCWEIYLVGYNQNLCQIQSETPAQTVNVQSSTIVADFEFLNSQSAIIPEPVEICPGDTVTFNNLTNTLDFDCQNTEFLWSISPDSNTEFQFVNQTNINSTNPDVRFFVPGTYQVTMEVNNSCSEGSITKEITVLDVPSVTFNPSSLEVCEDINENSDCYTLDFSDSTISPTYDFNSSQDPIYNWTVSGGSLGIDYTFENGTDQNSKFPVIRFCNYGVYEISTTVDGVSCPGSDNAIFTFAYTRTPIIENSDLLQEICSGDETQQVVYLSDVPTTTYSYNITADSAISGYQNIDFSNGIPVMTLINSPPSNVPNNLTITVTPNNGSCIGTPVDFIFTVNPKPVIFDQTAIICSGDDLIIPGAANAPPTIVPVATTYTWEIVSADSGIQNAISSSDLTGGPFTDMLIQSGPNALVNDLDVVQFVTYIVTPTSGDDGNCVGDPFEITVQVDPEPTISSVTLDPICSGEGFTYNPADDPNNTVPIGTLYEWTVFADGPSTGYTDQGPNGVSPISQTNLEVGNIPVTLTYTVTPYAPGTDGNRCPGDPFTINIQVNPKPVIFDQTAIICSGDDLIIPGAANAPPTIVPVATTYTWEIVSADSGIQNAISSSDLTGGPFTDMLIQSGPNALVNDLDVVQFVTYIVTPTSGDDGNCVGDPFEITVQVDPEPTISSVTLDPICSGEGFTYNPADDPNNTVPIGTLYEWTVFADGPSTGYTDQGPNGVSPISQTNLEVGNIPVTLTYTVTPYAPGTDGNRCPGDPFTINIQVNPKPVIFDQTAIICSGDDLIIPGAANAPPTIVPVATTYTWEIVSADSGIQNAISSSDLTGGPFTDMLIQSGPNALVNDLDVVQFVTYIVTPTSGDDGNCVGDPFEITVQVDPEPTISSVTLDPICSGEGFTYNPADDPNNTVPIGTLYEWTVFADGPSTGYTDQGPNGVSPISQTNLEVGNIPVTLTYTVTPYAPGTDGNRCPGDPFTINIQVNPVPQMDSIDQQTICSGTAFETPLYSSEVQGVSYSWTLIDENLIPSEITGYPQSSSYPVQGQLTGVVIENNINPPVPYTLEYQITVNFEGCEGNTVPFFITVNPSPIVSISPLNPQSICESGEFEPLFVSYDYPDTVTPSYQWWYNSTTDTNDIAHPDAAIAPGSDNTSSTYTPPSTPVGTFYYFCVVSFLSTDSNSTICNDIPSQTVEITVVDQPSISSNPVSEQTICLGGNLSENSLCISVDGGVFPVQYAWQAGTTYPVPNTDWGIFNSTLTTVSTNCLELPDDFFDNQSFEGEEIFFWAVVSFPDGNGCGGIISDPAKVTVFSDPILTGPLETQTVCQDSTPLDLTVTATDGAGTTYSYQWYDASTDQPIAGETLDTFTPPTSVVGTFNYYVIVTTDASGCETQSATSEVIVNQGPSIDVQPIANQALCLDGTAQDLTVSYVDGVGAPDYQWYASATCDTTDLSNPISGATSSSFTPPTSALGVINYFAVLTFPGGDCGAIVSDCAEVEVVEDPVVTVESALIPTPICEGGEINDMEVSYTGGVGNPTYTWYESDASGAPLTLIAGTNSPTYNPGIFTTAGFYYYVAEVTFNDNPDNGCDTAYSDVITVEVVGDPILTDPLETQTVCQDSTPLDLTVTATDGAGTTYSYQWYDASTDQPIAGETLDTFTPPTSVVGTFNYYVIVTTDASGCETQSATSEVIVNQGPSIDVQPIANQALCLDGTAQDLTVSYVDGVGAPDYQWYASATCDTTDLSNPISGATSSSFTPPTSALGVINYFAVLTFPGGDCGAIVSDCAEVEVVEDPVVTVESALIPTPICEGGEINDMEVSYTGGVGNPTYTWYESDASGAPLTLIAGTNSPTYNPGIFTTAGFYYYVAEVTFNDNPDNGCDTAYSDVITVEVVGDPILTDPLETQTVCQDSTPLDLTVTATDGAGTTYSYQWYDASTDQPIAGETLDTFTPPTSVVGTFNYYVIVTTDASGCETQSATSEVIVNQGPSIDVQPIANQALCLDGTAQDLTVSYVDGVGAPDYQWYASATCDTTDLSNPISGATSSSFTPPTSALGVINYFAVLTFPGGDCGAIVSDCAEVEVVEDPVVTVESALIPTPICEGGEINDMEVSYTGGVGDPTYTWYESDASGAPLTLIAGTNSPTYNPGIFTTAGFYYYVAEVTFNDNPDNGCDTAYSDVITVEVVGDPILTDPLETQTVCQDSTPLDLTVTATDGAGTTYSYQWYDASTDQPIAGETLDTFTPPTSVVGTFNYYVIVTTDASGCETQSATSEVIVNQGPSIDVQPIANQALCLDGTAQDLTVSYVDGVGAPDYQWYASATCDTTDLSNPISGATSSSFTPPTSALGVINYFAVLTFPGGDCGAIVSDCAEVEVVEDPVVTVESALIPTPICEGGEINDMEVSYTGGVGNPTYTWYESDASGAPLTLIAGTNSPTYNPGIFTTAGFYYYVAEVTFNDNPDNGCDTAYSDVITVEVVGDPILTDPLETQTVCQDSTPLDLTVTATDGAGTTYSYQWYDASTDQPIAGETLDTFTPPTSVVGTFNYYVIVTTDASGCETQSATSEVIVNQGPSIDVQPIANQALCLDGTAQDLTVSYVDGVGAPDYQWYASATCDTTDLSNPISGATSSSFTPPTSALGVINYFAVLTFPGGDCGAIVSDCAEVEVVEDPVVTVESALIPTPICEGGEINDMEVSYTGGVGDPTYTWYESDASGAPLTLIAGTNSPTYNPGIFTTAGFYYYVAEVTFNDNPDNGCDTAYSDVITVEVVGDPILTGPLETQTVCQDSTPLDLTVTATDGAGTTYSYQWYDASTDQPIAGETLDTFTPPTSVVGTFNYYVIVTTDASGCETQSATSEVIVNQGPSIDVQPIANQALCLDGTAQDLTVSYVDGVGAPDYQWYASATCDTTDLSNPISGATSSSFTPPTSALGVINYFAVLTFPGGDCGAIVSDCAEVEVVEDPVVTVESALIPTPICEGGEINDMEVSYTGGVGNPTYTWYESDASGAPLTPFAIINSPTFNPGIFTTAGFYYYVAEVTFNDNPNNGCDTAYSDVITVEVVGDPILTDPLETQTVCQDSTPLDLTVTATDGAGTTYSYQWYDASTDQPIAGETLDTFTPPTSVVGTFNYYVIVTTDASGCETQSATSEVIVNQGPSIDVQPIANQALCLDGTAQDLTVSYVDGVGAPDYQWYASATCDTTDLSNPISGATSSSFTPPTSALGVINYFAVLTFPGGDCGAIVSDCAEVEVVEDPVVTVESALIPTPICEGGEINDMEVSYTGGVGDPTYAWYESDASGAPLTLIAGTNSPTYNPGIFTTAGFYYYVAEVTFNDNPDNGCDTAYSDVITVEVVGDPILTGPLETQTVCQDSTPLDLTVTATDGAGTTYSYQWYDASTDQPIAGETLDTFTPPTSVVGTFNYYVIVTTDASGCETQSATSEVIVNQGPSIDVQPIANQALCLDGTAQDLTVSYVDGVGAPDYQWYASATCDTTDLSNPISGATSSSFTPPTSALGVINYFAVLTFPGGDCGAIVSDCAEVEVVEDPVVTVESALIPTPICEGGEINDMEVSYTGGVGDPTYAWYESDASGAPLTLIAITNSPTYNPGIFTTAGFYYYVAEVTFNDNPDNGCDTAYSDVITVEVVGDPILTDPLETQTVCQDSTPLDLTVTATDGAGTTYSYQWYDASTDQPIAGETLDTFTPPTSVVGTFNYYVIVTTDASGCETQSATSEVIVNQGPSIDVQPIANQALCLDGTAQDLTVSYVDGVGAPDYQWYASATCDTTDLSNPISGATFSTYTPLTGSNELGVFYYFAVLTFPGGGCGAIVSDCAEVEVVEDPVVTVESALIPTPICEGGEINDMEVSYTGGVGDPTYTWYESDASGAPLTLIAGTNSPTYNPGIFTTAGFYYYVAEVTFNDNPDNGCDTAYSDVITVEVVGDPILTDPLETQTVCQDSTPLDLTVTATDGAGTTYSYQWYDASTDQPIAGETLDTFTPPTSVVGTFNYYVIVTTDASGCETQSATSEVIVNPNPSIDTQPLAQQVLCQFDLAVDLEVSYVDGVGAPDYQWYASATCDTTDLSNPISGATFSTYTPLTGSNELGVFYYFAVLTFPDGGCGVIVSDCAEVEVKPIAIIPDVNVEICDLTSYTLNPEQGINPDSSTIVPSGTTYTWTFIDNIDILGESSASVGTFPNGNGAPSEFDSGVLDNTFFDIFETVTYEVTPWTDGCSGSPFEITITVSPEPQINEVITNIDCSYSEPICAGSIEINPVGIQPFTYNWVNTDSNAPTLPNPIDKDQFNLCPGIYELTITDSSGCSYNYQYEIIPPAPVDFNLIALTDISCNNINQLPCDGTIEVQTSGGTLPYTLVEWYRDLGDFNGFQLFDSSGDLELINLCAGDYLLKILDANGCEFLSPIYTIAEGFQPITISETLSNYNGYNVDCFGANSGSISLDISGGSGIFEYIFSNGNPAEDIIGNIDLGTNPSEILIFDFLTASQVPDDYTFTLIDSNCPSEIITNYTLTQPSELVITATLVDSIECFGELATYDVTAVGGVPPYIGTGLQSVLGGPATFVVSDSNGCSDDFSTVVIEPIELLANDVVLDAPCYEDDGLITITPTGGTGILTVSLFDAVTLLPISPSLNTTDGVGVTFSQPVGTYFYVVEDQNNCTYGPKTVIINQPDPIIVKDFDVIQPNCNTLPAWEFNNGSICITIIGGTNPFPIGTGWVDNGGGQWCLNNLSAGSYTIDVTDVNGCSLQNPIPDITLVRPPEITAVITNTIDIDCDTDTATQINTIIVNGGVPPYIITWSGPEFTVIPPNVMETSVPGNYSAFVNDQYGIANGCPPIEFPLDPITFFEFGVPDFTLSSANSSFCGVFAVSDPVTLTNISTGDIVSFEWDFGDGSPPISNVETLTHVYDVIGSYNISLTMEDLYGCIETYSETINVTQGYEIILPNAFTPNGDGINETIRPVYNCMTDVKLSIYDTWGSLIYAESGEDIYGWDGTIDGNPAENGNYIMVVRAEAFNGAIIDLNGPVTLIK